MLRNAQLSWFSYLSQICQKWEDNRSQRAVRPWHCLHLVIKNDEQRRGKSWPKSTTRRYLKTISCWSCQPKEKKIWKHFILISTLSHHLRGTYCSLPTKTFFSIMSQYASIVSFDGAAGDNNVIHSQWEHRLTKSNSVSGSTFPWQLVNDPVMGGLSHSNFSIDTNSSSCFWKGTVEIVPSLSAPGFCNFETMGLHKFADASPFTHLILRMKSSIDYLGWKISFAADTLNPQFKSFKADFSILADGNWQEVALPWNAFSNDWSAYTGEPITPCTASTPQVCPTLKNLRDISQFGFWTEGVQGDFNVQIDWVRAGNITSGHTWAAVSE